MGLIEEQISKFRAQVTPAMRCFHPVRVWNKKLGLFDYHNCGKCPYCLYVRSSELTQRCYSETKQHKYALFFTLTYDNEHIPYLQRFGKWYVCNRVRIVDGPCLDIVHYSEFDSSIPKIETSDGPVDVDAYGVLWSKDIQDFKKRLRINIQRKFNKYDSKLQPTDYSLRAKELEIRLFINGEYGPTTYRPHYHGLLWTDSQEVANFCFDVFRGRIDQDSVKGFHGLIYESWKNCVPSRCDVQFVSSSSPSYAASYIASVDRLPQVFQVKPFRPKVLASKNPIIGNYKVNFDTIRKMLFSGVIEDLQFDNDEKRFVPVPLPYSYLLRYFPKCEAFSVSSDDDKLLLFKKYFYSRFIKRPIVARGLFNRSKLDRVSYDENLLHLDTYDNDYFRYSNLAWFKRVQFWCFIRLTPLERFIVSDRLSEPVGDYLRPSQYIKLQRLLYEALEVRALKLFYMQQSELMDMPVFRFKTQRLYYLLSYYPEFVYSLPRLLSSNRQSVYIDKRLQSFGLRLTDLYTARRINDDIINFLKNNCVVSTFRTTISSKVKDKSKTKKYKEFYARKKGIIY